MKLCPCGYLGDKRGDCRCSADVVQRYRGKISGPLLDRIDIHVEVNRPPISVLRPDAPKGESSERVAERVLAAREIQMQRSGKVNAELSGNELGAVFQADDGCVTLLENAAEKLALSARAYQRVQKVARTIADLAAEETVTEMHVGEALALRHLDRRKR